jgi:glutamate-1-semialdehyde 2,1-aminomutase
MSLDLRTSERYTPGGVHSNTRRVQPLVMPESGRGGIIRGRDGKEYVDFHAAFGPIILGHSYEQVNRRVAEVLQTLDLYGIGATELEIEACRKIVEHVPSAEKVLLTNSGSESTFHAIRVSRAYTGRKKIIKFQGCYHGWHDYVVLNMLSAKEMVGKRDLGSSGLLEEVTAHTLICRFNDLDDVEKTILAHPGEIAAVILEPIPHNIGCVLPTDAFLQGLRRLTQEHGIVLIFDEVITGFRHALGGYQALCGVTPDLTTLGKAMANGYPIAALCGKAEIMDLFNTNPGGTAFFAGTYNGHAVGTSAVLATIEVLENEPVYEHNARLSRRMVQGIEECADRYGLDVTVKSIGSVFVPYFMKADADCYETIIAHNNAELDLKFRRSMVEKGFLMFPMALKRNHIMYTHTDEQIDRALEAVDQTMKELATGKGGAA